MLKNPAPPGLASMMVPPFSPGLQKRLLGWIGFLQLRNWNTVTWYFKMAMIGLVLLIIYQYFNQYAAYIALAAFMVWSFTLKK